MSAQADTSVMEINVVVADGQLDIGKRGWCRTLEQFDFLVGVYKVTTVR